MSEQRASQSEKKILLVEDERNLAFILELNLKAEGFGVLTASNGDDAINFYTHNGPFAAIILDVMIPETDGFEVARYIRIRDNKTGIIMLTARASDEDRLKGLNIGADDYLTKPFHLQELLMRVKRMAERADFFQREASSLRSFGPFTLDTETLILRGPKGESELTALEADMLAEFMDSRQKVLSRRHLLHKVWGVAGNIETRTVDNFIVRLRRIIEDDPSNPRYLISVRGRGYRLTDPNASDPVHGEKE